MFNASVRGYTFLSAFKKDISIAAGRTLCVRDLTTVQPGCFLSVAVQDLQSAAGVRGFHVVLVRSPDDLPFLGPVDVHSLTATVRACQMQRLAQDVGRVLELFHEAHRF